MYQKYYIYTHTYIRIQLSWFKEDSNQWIEQGEAPTFKPAAMVSENQVANQTHTSICMKSLGLHCSFLSKHGFQLWGSKESRNRWEVNRYI